MKELFVTNFSEDKVPVPIDLVAEICELSISEILKSKSFEVIEIDTDPDADNWPPEPY